MVTFMHIIVDMLSGDIHIMHIAEEVIFEKYDRKSGG